MQVLIYIAENYIWFLSGAILILLAVIGYYADKTNFGQTKDTKNKDKEKSSNIENINLNDTLNNDEDENNLQTQINQDELNDNLENIKSDLSNNGVEDYIVPENLTYEESGISQTNNENLDSTNNLGIINENSDLIDENIIEPLNSEQLESNNEDSLLIDENFNRFNEEFNSILPQKELINNDLLSDIDDLELGKTQKIDLVNIPDLDDIELPKIKTLVEDEQDIWKF